MRTDYNNSTIIKAKWLSFVLIFASTLVAQHRGDNLSFQGLSDKNNVSVKAVAMGSALTSLTGNISALFYNPAGLAKIKELQVSISSNYYTKQYHSNYKVNFLLQLIVLNNLQ